MGRAMKKRDTIKNIKTNMIIKGLSKIKNAWKNHDIIINQVELKNGDISGTFEGKLIMEQSKKITNNELLEFFNKKFDNIEKRLGGIDKRLDAMEKTFEKRFDGIDKRLDNIDAKIDLILATPTIQKEIDHKALNKLK